MSGALPDSRRVLIVGAHPDDPDFFCAGTVARWTDAGVVVRYVVVTSGDKGQPPEWDRPEGFTQVREAEQEASARLLGVEGVTFLRFTDGEVFDTLELRERLTAEIRRFRPDLLLTHDPLTRLYRQHPDHRAVGAAALAAAFPACRLATFFPEHLKQDLRPHVVPRAALRHRSTGHVRRHRAGLRAQAGRAQAPCHPGRRVPRWPGDAAAPAGRGSRVSGRPGAGRSVPRRRSGVSCSRGRRTGL